MTVYLLQHEYEDENHSDCKTIGVFSTKEKAENTKELLKSKNGFCNYPDGFYIDPYTVDEIVGWMGSDLTELISQS